MNAIDAWRRLTGREACRFYSCSECRKLYNMDNGCPLDGEMTRDEFSETVRRVVDLLQNRTANEKEITPEELAGILEECL